MKKVLGLSVDQLRHYIERLERLEAEKSVIGEDIKEVLSEAKGNGYDTKVLRQVLKIRKVSTNDRVEQEVLLEAYLSALGMLHVSDSNI